MRQGEFRSWERMARKLRYGIACMRIVCLHEGEAENYVGLSEVGFVDWSVAAGDKNERTH